MTEVQLHTIDRESLKRKLGTEKPDNTDASHGYALVNVLKPSAFEEEHIPGSINIPSGEMDKFEKRFAKDKGIVVFCASPECDASPQAAESLSRRGFTNVKDYESGMSEWKNAGYEVATGKV